MHPLRVRPARARRGRRRALRLAPLVLVLGGVGMLWIQHDYRPNAGWIVVSLLYAGMLPPVAVFIRLRTVARMIADAGATAIKIGSPTAACASIVPHDLQKHHSLLRLTDAGGRWRGRGCGPEILP